MSEKPKGDRLWLVLCTALGVAVDVTLNKYSSALPGWAVVAIWSVPAVLFVVWFWRVEKTRDWVRTRFLEHPVSYVLMFLILIPFGWQATATMMAKLRTSKPQNQIAAAYQGTAQTPLKPALSIPAAAPSIIAQSTPQQPKTASPKAKPEPRPTHLTQGIAAPASNTTASAQPAPTYGSQTCVGSACAQGPDSQATYNQFGVAQPPPAVVNLTKKELKPVDGFKDDEDIDPNHPALGPAKPGVYLSFSVDREFSNPKFAITCDRRCLLTSQTAVAAPPLVTLHPLYLPDHPTTVISQMGFVAPLQPTSTVMLVVRSADEKPITVLRVEGYIMPSKKESYHHRN